MTIGEAIFPDHIVRHVQEVAAIIEQIHVQFQLQVLVHIPNNNNIDRDMIIYTIFLLNSAEKICIEIHVECILS